MTETVKLRSRPGAEKRRPSMFWVLAGLVLPVWSLMVRYRFTRASRLPKSGPFILAPNHYSEIDPIAVGAAVWHLGRVPRFMAKASLFKIPVLGWMMRASGQIPVEREGSSRGQRGGSPIGAATQLIANDSGVVVYPEGTLTRDPDLWPMRGKSGAVRLALESGIPLIPVAHWGTQELMPRYGKTIKPFPRKTINVAVGKPINLDQFKNSPMDQKTVSAATKLLMDEITHLLEGLRGEPAPEERWDPSKHQQNETGRF